MTERYSLAVLNALDEKDCSKFEETVVKRPWIIAIIAGRDDEFREVGFLVSDEERYTISFETVEEALEHTNERIDEGFLDNLVFVVQDTDRNDLPIVGIYKNFFDAEDFVLSQNSIYGIPAAKSKYFGINVLGTAYAGIRYNDHKITVTKLK
ncbi:hypothetical protein P10VF_046 [Rhizobium phage vB_RleM_P10VF]|uniref:Uncharacterized protein n=1 Tax=Rhizobium phage vB_RleM_P10VF TaxID=1527770 RepID=A0A076YNA1_9CAUD|nr:hypothetical protein P10VF_046 [Rhizobium phage vB_RleM_P10VF]AIK68259.1 hypothetical protein P10VF_046 [Rhizobium phage vB_RleM_P10VF]